MQTTIKQASEYSKLGVLTHMSAVRDAKIEGNWTLIGHHSDGERTFEVVTARGEWKSYKSLDTLIKDTEEVLGRVSSFDLK